MEGNVMVKRRPWWSVELERANELRWAGITPKAWDNTRDNLERLVREVAELRRALDASAARIREMEEEIHRGREYRREFLEERVREFRRGLDEQEPELKLCDGSDDLPF